MGRHKSAAHSHYPRGLIARKQKSGKTYFYASVKDKDGKRVEVPVGNDYDTALRRFGELKGLPITRRRKVSKRFEGKLFSTLKTRARGKGWAVDISKEDIREMFVKQDGKCALTGIPFDADEYETQRVRPWLPSVDRIDMSKGYERGNVRLVCAAVNLAVNQFSEAIFMQIAKCYLRQATRHSPTSDIEEEPKDEHHLIHPGRASLSSSF